MPHPWVLANEAIPTAAAGNISRTRKLLRKTIPMLLTQRTALETVSALRGARISHKAIAPRMPKKALMRIAFS